MMTSNSRKMTRRNALKAISSAACMSLFPKYRLVHAAPRPEFRNSLCASQFSDGVFSEGIQFRAGNITAGNLEELQRMMMAYGSMELFTRLGSRITDPTRPNSREGMDSAIERAQLAKRLGIPLNPELLLCAYYGDESGQPEPDFTDYPEIKLNKPWRQLTLEEICDAMRTYGELAARQIIDTGVTVNVWDLGNEIDLGFAGVALPPFSTTIGRPGWRYQPPDGVDPEIGKMTVAKFFQMSTANQVAWGQQHLWGYIGSMLSAIKEGIHEVDPKGRVVTHLGGLAVQTPEIFAAFYEAVEANGFRSEALGASFYPTAYPYFDINPGVDRLVLYKQSAELAMERLGKPIYLAEFGYAAGPMTYGEKNWANPVPGYPISPDGQAAFLRDLVEWGVKNGTLVGVRPWAPDFVGSGWQGMALFDTPVDGIADARPGLSAIQEGLELAQL